MPPATLLFLQAKKNICFLTRQKEECNPSGRKRRADRGRPLLASRATINTSQFTNTNHPCEVLLWLNYRRRQERSCQQSLSLYPAGGFPSTMQPMRSRLNVSLVALRRQDQSARNRLRRSSTKPLPNWQGSGLRQRVSPMTRAAWSTIAR